MSTDLALLLVQGVVLAVFQLVLSQQQSGWSSDVRHAVSGWFTQLGHPGNQKLIMAVMGCQGQGIHIFWGLLYPLLTPRYGAGVGSSPHLLQQGDGHGDGAALLCFYWSALADNLGMTNKL